MNSSIVLSLSTGREVGTYSLPPRQALIAAREQVERHNFNTWTYPGDVPEIEEGRWYLFLGDFVVRRGWL